MRTLVVYYSRSGDTRRVAHMMAQRLGADLQELIDTKSRRGLWGFLSAGRDAIKKKTAHRTGGQLGRSVERNELMVRFSGHDSSSGLLCD